MEIDQKPVEENTVMSEAHPLPISSDDDLLCAPTQVDEQREQPMQAVQLEQAVQEVYEEHGEHGEQAEQPHQQTEQTTTTTTTTTTTETLSLTEDELQKRQEEINLQYAMAVALHGSNNNPLITGNDDFIIPNGNDDIIVNENHTNIDENHKESDLPSRNHRDSTLSEGIDSDELISTLDSFAVSEEFLQNFNEEVPCHPTISSGPFRDAIDLAKKNFKIVIVYLHHQTHCLTSHFCRETLGRTELADFIDHNFLFWMGQVDTSVEPVLTKLLHQNEITFPFLVLVADLGSGVSILNIHQGSLEPDELISRLFQDIENHGSILEELRLKLEEQNKRLATEREIKQLQEQEYAAAVEQDKEKEQQAMLEEAIRLSTLEEKRAAKLRKKESLPPEPPPGTVGVCSLVMRFPNGSRLERRFLGSEKLQTVIDFIESTTEETGCESGHINLATAYPRKTYTDLNMTLADAGLTPQALLHVT